MPINSVEELFERLNDPDAGYKIIEELEHVIVNVGLRTC